MVTAWMQIDPLGMCLAAEKLLHEENAALWRFVDAFKRWGREEGNEGEMYEALADLIPYEQGADQPTIQQVLSDPRSADRAALDYCNEEVRNCLDEADELRKEIAALWAFVRTQDAEEAASPDERRVRRHYAAQARDALRQYEDGGDR